MSAAELGEKELRRLLRLRAEIGRRRPRFIRMNSWYLARLDDSWRSPRSGLDNKIRLERKGFPARVKIGYRGPRAVRGLHPSGKMEVLVHTPSQLEGLDPRVHVVRIAATVGARKRGEILRRAEELGLKVVNAGV
ncbi:MAG: 50S ribosomal protein L32e [Thermoproteales archaeon]|nr:50S ribosomal protein L32e [Thermoproteales archaeon]